MSTHSELVELAIFSDAEISERQRHIATLKNFAGASVAAAQALAKIRDKKLYRPHATLKEFCVKECGWTEQRLFQIIKFAKIRESLPVKTKHLLSRESHARELSKVPEGKRTEVLEAAQQHGDINAKSIRHEAAKVTTEITGEVDKAGYPIPRNAMPYWNRREEVQKLLSHLSAVKVALANISDADLLYRRVNNIRGKADKAQDYYNEIKGALPDYVCYSCDGIRPRDCRMCGGTGVVSEFEWRSKADPEGHHRREKSLRKMKDPF